MINVQDIFYILRISSRNSERLSQCQKKCRVVFEANFRATNANLEMDHEVCQVGTIYLALTRHRNSSVLSNYLDTLLLMRAIARESPALAVVAAAAYIYV